MPLGMQVSRRPVPASVAMETEKPDTMKVSVAHVLIAVRSLYEDELKPFGRIILKRIREHAALAQASLRGLPLDEADADSAPRVDPRRLRRVCESCRQLRVFQEDGKEYSVQLVGQPAYFVDVCSSYDPYPDTLWFAAAAYFEALEGEEAVLPGGRYACAQALAMRKLSFIEGMSLGQLCHLVQVSISQRKLLGYRDGHLVPFLRSEECMKEQCAFAQQPSVEPTLPLASLEAARQGLWEILNCGPDMRGVTLSNVKRLFRARYCLELNETVLGHSRLHSLLQDPCFHDICYVEAERHGQVMVRPIQQLPSPLCYVPVQVPMPAVPSVPQLSLRPPLGEEMELLSPGASPRSMSMSPTRKPPGVFHGAQPASSSGDDTCAQSIAESSEEGSQSADSSSLADSVWGLVRVKNTFIHLGEDDDFVADVQGADGARSCRSSSLPRSFRSGRGPLRDTLPSAAPAVGGRRRDALSMP